jgi:zinc and cadmium transporter
MENAALFSILTVIIISLISLIGIFTLFFTNNFVKRINFLLISLAAGTLIGDVFFHIIPELSHDEFKIEYSALIILGILLFFVLENFLHWRHCHAQHNHNHKHPVAINNLVADGLHNFIDGLIIAAGFLVSQEVGIATAIAVILHEIPQEIGDFGILVHGGFSKIRALVFNFLSGLLAILGAVIGLVLGDVSENLEVFIISLAAGGFLYIAIADLFPILNKELKFSKSFLQFIFVVIGLTAMFTLTLVEAH